MTIRLTTLGGLRAFRDDVELTALPGQPLRAAFLVHLATERAASRAALTALFWPESDEAAARHALRQCLYNLSTELGPAWLEKHAQELRVADVVECDIVAFEDALRRGSPKDAAALYAGPFLDGVHLIDVKPWEMWVDAKRAHLARAFRKSCREWVNRCVEAGDLKAAIGAARQWSAPDPFDDEAQHRLIEVLVAAGERTDALRQFGVYARLLEADGLTPLDETRQLVEAIRHGSPAPDSASIHPVPAPAADPVVLVAAEPVRAGDDRTGLPARIRREGRRRRWALPAGITALAAAAVVIVQAITGPSGGGGEGAIGLSALDTTLYAVFPLRHDASIAEPFHDTELLEDALGRWDGVSLVPPFQVDEELARITGPLLLDTLRNAAAAVGAGRFVAGESTAINDSVRIRVALFDTGTGLEIFQRTERVPRDLLHAAPSFEALADALLFRGGGAGPRTEMPPGTRSAAARRAFAEGQVAIFEWDLPRADSQFSRAIRGDQQYALAHLWLAQVRMWQSRPAAAWASHATLASFGRPALPRREQLLADGLLELSNGDVERACPIWKRLTEQEALDFTVWYGYAVCLRSDSAVVRDSANSPTGWRFRSSIAEAADAFQRAFLIRPSLYRAFAGGSYGQVRALLHTSRRDLRRGYSAAPDSFEFLAYPEWRDGRLAFVPDFAARFTAGEAPVASPGAVEEALRMQRRAFHQLATAWVTAFPDSAGAMEALAIALELLHDASAIDTLRRARALSRDPETATRIAASEVWLRLKFSIPQDPDGVRAARLLADSLLGNNPPEDVRDGRALAGLAALLGRGALAASYLRSPAARRAFPNLTIATAAPPLLAFAALGGPADSLRFYEGLVSNALLRMPAALRAGARDAWLVRSATLAFPDYTLDALRDPDVRTVDYLFTAQAAFLRGDTMAARLALQRTEVSRLGQRIEPAVLTIDGVLPEAALLEKIGEPRTAIHWLDGPLNGLYRTEPQAFADPTRAASLVRALALRARLAARTGDPADARRWAALALELLTGPDPFLEPLVRELRELAG